MASLSRGIGDWGLGWAIGNRQHRDFLNNSSLSSLSSLSPLSSQSPVPNSQHFSYVEDCEIRLLHPSHQKLFRPFVRWIIVVSSVVNRLMHHLNDMTRSKFIWLASSHIDDINSLSNEFIPLVDKFSKQIGRNFFRRLANCMEIFDRMHNVEVHQHSLRHLKYLDNQPHRKRLAIISLLYPPAKFNHELR